MEGCLKEYIILPENCCYPVPLNMSFENAMLCEPISIGFYATSFANSLKGKKIGILGMGPIGLSVLLISKAFNTSKVYATDLLDYRLEIAKMQGADWTGNPAKINCVKKILDLEKYQLDYVFECCGKQEAVDQGIMLLKPGGKLVIVGIPEFDNYFFNVHLMRRNEIVIQNVRRQNEYVDKTIELLKNNIIDPAFMATHNFPLLETEKAFDLVANYKDNVIKAVINID